MNKHIGHTNSPGLDIQLERVRHAATLTLSGTLNRSSCSRCRDLLSALIEQGITDVRVEFGESGGVDVNLLAMLRNTQNRLRLAGGVLHANSARPELGRELSLIGLALADGAEDLGHQPRSHGRQR